MEIKGHLGLAKSSASKGRKTTEFKDSHLARMSED